MFETEFKFTLPKGYMDMNLKKLIIRKCLQGNFMIYVKIVV